MLSHSFAFPVTAPFKHPSISPCHYPSLLPSPACLFPHADSHWVNLCFLVRTSSTKSKPRPKFSSSSYNCFLILGLLDTVQILIKNSPAHEPLLGLPITVRTSSWWCPTTQEFLPVLPICSLCTTRNGSRGCKELTTSWQQYGARLLLMGHSALLQQCDWSGQCFKSTPLHLLF